MDTNKMTVFIVVIICATIITLALLGYNSDINYTKPDGTSLTVTSSKVIVEKVVDEVIQVQVLTDDSIK